MSDEWHSKVCATMGCGQMATYCARLWVDGTGEVVAFYCAECGDTFADDGEEVWPMEYEHDDEHQRELQEIHDGFTGKARIAELEAEVRRLRTALKGIAYPRDFIQSRSPLAEQARDALRARALRSHEDVLGALDMPCAPSGRSRPAP